MKRRFELSYMDHQEFETLGHPTVKRITEYKADARLVEYIRNDFNHNGNPTAFERNVTSRHNGAIVDNHDSYNGERGRWSPEVYNEYLQCLDAEWEETKIKWAAYKVKYADDWPELEPQPLPLAPKYFDHGKGTFTVEPWFDFPIRMAADSVKQLRRSDVYRVLENTPEGQRRAMVGYLLSERPEFAEEIAGCLADMEAEVSQ